MLKHIETKEDYAEYEERIQFFLVHEGIDTHSQIYDEDGDSLDPSFSCQPCECCNRPLGGDRYKIRAGSINGNMFDYDICVDCLYYLEYGTLDDMTMLNLED